MTKEGGGNLHLQGSIIKGNSFLLGRLVEKVSLSLAVIYSYRSQARTGKVAFLLIDLLLGGGKPL